MLMLLHDLINVVKGNNISTSTSCSLTIVAYLWKAGRAVAAVGLRRVGEAPARRGLRRSCYLIQIDQLNSRRQGNRCGVATGPTNGPGRRLREHDIPSCQTVTHDVSTARRGHSWSRTC